MDQKQSKTLYDVPYTVIVRKHFVAGFSQALGGFAVTLASWTVIALVILKVILPSLMPIIRDLSGIIDKAAKMTGTTTTKGNGGIPIQIPDSLIQQFSQIQK